MREVVLYLHIHTISYKGILTSRKCVTRLASCVRTVKSKMQDFKSQCSNECMDYNSVPHAFSLVYAVITYK